MIRRWIPHAFIVGQLIKHIREFIFTRNSVMAHNFIEVLNSIGEKLVGLHPIIDRIRHISQILIALSNGIIGMPYLLAPTPDFDAFFISIDGVLVLPTITVTIRQIKRIAIIIG